MNKTHRIWANVVAIIYIANFVFPTLMNFNANNPMTTVMQVISAIVFIGSPIFFFWLYRQEKRIGYLIAGIITLLILILGVVAVSIVYL